MLIQFTTQNFRSFKDPVTLSMVSGKSKSKNKSLDEDASFSSLSGIKLLKCAVIYGANASGKSNLFSALAFMRRFVLNSSKESQVDELIGTEPFKLAIGLDQQPSFFEITFAIESIIYQYQFSADQALVHGESLIAKVGSKETTLFERNGGKITCHKQFSEGSLLSEKTRSNALFLSVCANFDGEISKRILRWFRSLRIISGLTDENLMGLTRECLAGERHSKISELLKSFDLGMEGVALGESEDEITIPPNATDEIKEFFQAVNKMVTKNGPPPRRVTTLHNVFDSDGVVQGQTTFELAKEESQGSKKLVAMSGPIIDTLEHSGVLVIDEFDARLHPILSKTIIKIFNSLIGNSRNAQLIVATHDTNLLDKELLRRDQIWFVEKDKFGSSHLTSLIEYRVRNDASFEKDYIMGKYGAIPLLGNLSQIFEPLGAKPISRITPEREGA